MGRFCRVHVYSNLEKLQRWYALTKSVINGHRTKTRQLAVEKRPNRSILNCYTQRSYH